MTAVLRPLVVFERVAAQIQHAVDAARTAEDTALKPRQPASLQRRHRFGFEIPVAPPKRAGDEGGARNLRGEPQPFTASLDQGNPCVREHLRQPAGNDATSSTRPDDNVISAQPGRTVSRSQPALRRRDLEADMVVRPAPPGPEFDTAYLGNHL